jgi:hypothetical protein
MQNVSKYKRSTDPCVHDCMKVLNFISKLGSSDENMILRNMGEDHLTMVILIILKVNSSINIKIILKNRKKNYRHVLLFIDWYYLNFMWFHYSLILHQRLLNSNHYKFYKILIVFDGVSNDNEITWNLNDHQFIGRKNEAIVKVHGVLPSSRLYSASSRRIQFHRHIYKYISIFKFSFNIFLSVYYQNYRNTYFQVIPTPEIYSRQSIVCVWLFFYRGGKEFAVFSVFWM